MLRKRMLPIPSDMSGEGRPYQSSLLDSWSCVGRELLHGQVVTAK